MSYPRIIIPFIAGLFFCFGHPSFISEVGFILFPIIGTTLLFLCLKFESRKQDLIKIFIFCSTVNYVAFYWIPETITTFGKIPYPVSLLLFVGFGFVVMPFFWVGYLLVSFNKPKNIFLHYQKKYKNAAILVLAGFFPLVEYFTPTQFPVRLGQPWLNTPSILGWTPWFGLPFYSFISYLLVLILYSTVKEKSLSRPLSFIALLVLAAGFFIKPFSFQEKSLDSEEPSNFHLRIVQGNIGNYMKIQSELGQFTSLQEVYNRYSNHSTAKTDKDLDLIVWPETAYPHDLNSDYLSENPFATPPIFKNIIDQTGAAILFGGYDIGKLEQSQNWLQTLYNSTFLINSDGSYNGVYHKHLLIPFGENIPLGPITPHIKDYIPGVSFFSEGRDYTVFSSKSGLNFITPICYEILSPTHIRRSLTEGTNQGKQPHFIINLTNDSWYGKTAEPYQHLFLSKWRALEFQTPIIRSTNSGITSVIDIDGSESKRLGLGEIGHLDLKLFLPERNATFYQKYGIATYLSSWLGLIFLGFFIDLFTRQNKDC